MDRRRVTIFATFAGVIAVIGYLLFSGFNDTTVAYYRTVTELKTLGAQAESKNFRVSGTVLPGTVVRAADGLSVSFTIDELGETLPVSYRGILPDTFKEGVGVLLEGRYANGRFEAMQIFTKCASKYQSEEEMAAPEKTS
jgi:cytochrome c-type biogenesis protein CcmE